MSLGAALAAHDVTEQGISMLKSIPGQTGSAILDITGEVLSSSGELEDNADALSQLYLSLQDVRGLMNVMDPTDKFKRFSVAFDTFSYVVTISGGKIFVVKKSN
eukprot:TRINITY_DN218_c0_g1_i4.p1 TRINITY_DN218_c0_g1~~TRINITY_DN218_c0_g1_i4.p1  ORF type:complete len:121 (+),score=45.27 TRINITY_DN218_c0_g1_i4:53-364(+)